MRLWLSWMPSEIGSPSGVPSVLGFGKPCS